MALWLATQMNEIAYEALYDEEGTLYQTYENLRAKYSVPGKPFLFQVSYSLYNLCSLK